MHRPGSIRDAIIEHLKGLGKDASVAEIDAAVRAKVGDVGGTSVRSYLRLNTPEKFERTGLGRYKLSKAAK